MKKERTKPTKKKILSYYLIAAACLLVVAAITVGVVFGIKPKTPDSGIIDSGNDKPTTPDDGNDNKPTEPDDGDKKPVDNTSSYVFIVPIREANLTQAQVFCYDKTRDRYAVHKGVDFAAAAGVEVLAAVDGTVESVYKSDKLYGAVITVSHANGLKTVYKFVDPLGDIKAGDKVNRGDVIATVTAATGVENMDGDHLHFEVFENGVQVDPDDYLNVSPK